MDDNVKIYKKKDKLDQERNSLWSDKTYTIERVTVSPDQIFNNLDGLTKEYMRHDLLKD